MRQISNRRFLINFAETTNLIFTSLSPSFNFSRPFENNLATNYKKTTNNIFVRCIYVCRHHQFTTLARKPKTTERRTNVNNNNAEEQGAVDKDNDSLAH